MKPNVGGIDRILRIALGAVLIAWAAMGGPLWAWLGLVVLATGVFRFCALYTLIGVDTCATKRAD